MTYPKTLIQPENLLLVILGLDKFNHAIYGQLIDLFRVTFQSDILCKFTYGIKHFIIKQL